MPEATGQPLPTRYIPHGGGPCFFMDWNPPLTWDKLAARLAKLGKSVSRPEGVEAARAIIPMPLCLSFSYRQ
ncbi:MAG TPA: hypothetical protein VK708_21040 [Bryobacteraceae bacterium]|nr:hypothetical protein [Bryobacteraceae bacterium]